MHENAPHPLIPSGVVCHVSPAPWSGSLTLVRPHARFLPWPAVMRVAGTTIAYGAAFLAGGLGLRWAGWGGEAGAASTALGLSTILFLGAVAVTVLWSSGPSSAAPVISNAVWQQPFWPADQVVAVFGLSAAILIVLDQRTPGRKFAGNTAILGLSAVMLALVIATADMLLKWQRTSATSNSLGASFPRCQPVETPLGFACGGNYAALWLSFLGSGAAVVAIGARLVPCSAEAQVHPESFRSVALTTLNRGNAGLNMTCGGASDEPEQGATANRTPAFSAAPTRRRLCNGPRCAALVIWDSVPVRLLRSWFGKHCVLLANAALNVYVFGQPVDLPRGDLRQGILALCLLLAAVSALISVVALVVSRTTYVQGVLGRFVDWHFRLIMLAKSTLLVAKTCMLTMPFSEPVKDLEYVWSCKAQINCPLWCSVLGHCSVKVTADRSLDSCICIGTTPAKAQTIALTCTTGAFLFLFSIAKVYQLFVHQVGPPRMDTTVRRRFRFTLLGFVVLNSILCVLLALSAWLPSTCYQGKLAFAFRLAAPIVPLIVLANEAQWVVEAWKTSPVRHAPIIDVLGIRVLIELRGVRVLCIAASAVAALSAWASIAELSAAGRPCAGLHMDAAACVVLVLAAAAAAMVAALASSPLLEGCRARVLEDR